MHTCVCVPFWSCWVVSFSLLNTVILEPWCEVRPFSRPRCGSTSVLGSYSDPVCLALPPRSSQSFGNAVCPSTWESSVTLAFFPSDIIRRVQSEACTKNYLRATKFLTKNAPKFSPKCCAFVLWFRRNPTKFPPKNQENSPTSFCRRARRRHQDLHVAPDQRKLLSLWNSKFIRSANLILFAKNSLKKILLPRISRGREIHSELRTNSSGIIAVTVCCQSVTALSISIFMLWGQVLAQALPFGRSGSGSFYFLSSHCSPNTGGRRFYCYSSPIKVNTWTVRFWPKMTFFGGPRIGPEPNCLLGPEPNCPKWAFLIKIVCFISLWNHYKNRAFRETRLKRSKIGKPKNTNFSHIWKQSEGAYKNTVVLQLMTWTKTALFKKKQKQSKKGTTKQQQRKGEQHEFQIGEVWGWDFERMKFLRNKKARSKRERKIEKKWIKKYLGKKR